MNKRKVLLKPPLSQLRYTSLPAPQTPPLCDFVLWGPRRGAKRIIEKVLHNKLPSKK